MALFNTVVGINVNHVPKMVDAINEYIKGVNDVINRLNSEVTTKDAFSGQYATAVSNYVAAVEKVCKSVISELEIFKSKLNEISASYTSKDQSLGSTIGQASSSLASQYNVSVDSAY